MGARADGALSAAAPSFDEHLAREIVRSERTRTAILAGVLAAVAVFFPLFAFSQRSYYLETFGSPRAGIIIVSACLALVGYELFVRAVLGRWQARGRAPSPALRYWNALAETSMPTILIALVSRHIDPLYVLQGPGAFFYGIFIVLSTLRLDFRLSVFTGVVAAVQYLALFAWLVPQSAAAAGTPFATAPFYIMMSAILVLTGIAASVIADPPTELSRALLLGAGWVINVLVAEWIIQSGRREERYVRARIRSEAMVDRKRQRETRHAF